MTPEEKELETVSATAVLTVEGANYNFIADCVYRNGVRIYPPFSVKYSDPAPQPSVSRREVEDIFSRHGWSREGAWTIRTIDAVCALFGIEEKPKEPVWCPHLTWSDSCWCMPGIGPIPDYSARWTVCPICGKGRPE